MIVPPPTGRVNRRATGFLLSGRGFHWTNEVPYNRFGPRTEDPPKLPPPPKRP